MKFRFPTIQILTFLFLSTVFVSCNQDPDPEPDGPQLIFKFAFNPNQERYNSLGQIASVPNGHAAQSPSFNTMSAHYVEMIPNAWTLLGAGEILYTGDETTAGGSNAIDFSKAKVVGENEVFISIPLSEVAAGTYEFIRVSVTYQNYDIVYNASGFNQITGTLASFIGFNTYVQSYDIDTRTIAVNSNKLQGYWGFETTVTIPGVGTFTETYEGQAPAGATTVVNPLANSPIPPGSCLVTGAFASPLVINGDETEDVTVVLSVSTNQSFEWTDPDGNGQYDPADGDVPVDMGLRGIKAIVQ